MNLSRLAGIAHERELGTELEKLEVSFHEWRAGDIDAFTLNDRIHRFHDGASRDLWKLYSALDPTHAVARAVALGILERDEAPQEVLKELAQTIEYFEKHE